MTRIYQCGKYLDIQVDKFSDVKIKKVPVKEDSNDDKRDYQSEAYHRAKQNVKRICLANLSNQKKTDVFFTLTYEETMLDYNQAMKDFATFRKRLERKGVKMKYIFVVERQKKRGKKEGNQGTWHFHGILFDVQNTCPTISKGKKIDKEIFDTLWGHGYTFLTFVDYSRKTKSGLPSHVALSNYLTKYLTKDGDKNDLPKNAKRYKCSRNLIRPQQYNAPIDYDMDYIVSLGDFVSHSTYDVTDWLTTDYYLIRSNHQDETLFFFDLKMAYHQQSH